MKIKKILSLGLVLTIVSSASVGCSSSDEEKSSDKLKITMIADLGGINDQSFNQSAWEGLQRAKEELGVEVQVLESTKVADYETNVETAVDENSDLVIGIGFQMDKAIENGAKNYPENKFAIVDYAFEKPLDNVTSIAFNAQEAAYLVGVIAAKMTETCKVGFIGGTKLPTIESFEYGFLAGVDSLGRDVKVSRQYADTYTDASKGKAIANQMHKDNVDIIFTAAGSTGNGAIEAARENNKKAIGVDMDQNHIAPENVITSAIKRVDNTVYDMVKKLVEGKFNGGEVTIAGLKDNAVDIAPSTDKFVSKEILNLVQEQAEKIKNGEIVIPVNEEEYNNMKNSN